MTRAQWTLLLVWCVALTAAATCWLVAHHAGLTVVARASRAACIVLALPLAGAVVGARMALRSVRHTPPLSDNDRESEPDRSPSPRHTPPAPVRLPPPHATVEELGQAITEPQDDLTAHKPSLPADDDLDAWARALDDRAARRGR